MRSYELAIVADPRLSDEETVALVEEYKAMVAANGGEVSREENWGKRKLAYPIAKLSEGRYVFLYLQSEDGRFISEVELRLRQNEKVLRYLTVRTDLDLKRATNRAKPGQPPRTFIGAADVARDVREEEA